MALTVTKLNPDSAFTMGVTYIGEIIYDYKTLVKKFGKPQFDGASGDNKVKIEWSLIFSDGTIATVYDWKNYNKTNLEIKKFNKIWNVGGHNKKALINVKKLLKNG